MLNHYKKDIFYISIIIVLLLTIVGMRIIPKESPEPIVYNIMTEEEAAAHSGLPMSAETEPLSERADGLEEMEGEDAKDESITLDAEIGASVPRAVQTPSKVTANDPKVNINTASKSQLMRLPGIGDVTAQRIIDYRTKNGRFNSTTDIVKVSGIGDKKFQELKDFITIE